MPPTREGSSSAVTPCLAYHLTPRVKREQGASRLRAEVRRCRRWPLRRARGTDGLENINARYELLTQFVFEGVDLKPYQTLDPQRNFTYEEKLIMYRRSGGRCQLGADGNACGREIEFDDAVVDHVVPHSRGGITVIDNGRCAHRKCNIARGVHDDFDPRVNCCLLQTVVISM
jgi:hypothetical protein